MTLHCRWKGSGGPSPLLLGACLALVLAAGPAGGREGTDRVDRSIERGLQFIAGMQRADGGFRGRHGTTVGVTGLSGMAFLAKGYLPGEPPYGDVLNGCVDYMLENHDENTGWMGRAGRSGRMYSHTIGTLFLSEVSGMLDPERQAQVDELLPKAVQLLLAAQQVEKSEQHSGGWRYLPNSTDSDMSVSGWALMALRSARLNGAPVPRSAIDDAVAYVLRHHNSHRGTFGYRNTTSNARTLTGAGLLCLELSGKHGHPATFAAARYLMDTYEELPNQTRGLYGLYYTAQGLFQIGGEEWRRFSDWMYAYWIPRQRSDGSWDRGEENCLAYQTAMVALSFAVPYRQLPIYQRDETVDE